MLIIARKKNETIHIGEDIEIVISELSRSVVKVAISAPRGTRVLRGEIYRAVKEANHAASETVSNGGEIVAQNLVAFAAQSAHVIGASSEKSTSALPVPAVVSEATASIRAPIEERTCPTT